MTNQGDVEDMDIRMSVGNKIRDFRKKLALSQDKLAQISGLDRTYINSVENGRRNISEKIAIALKVKIDNFFDS